MSGSTYARVPSAADPRVLTLRCQTPDVAGAAAGGREEDRDRFADQQHLAHVVDDVAREIGFE